MNRAIQFVFIVLAPAAASFAETPATQPGPQSLANSTILVLPIEPPAGAYGWVSRAIQQDILVDLTQMTRAHVLAPSSAPALDADAALRAGRDAGADYVVFGLAQSSATQLRVTGQVLEVANGKNLAYLKATAPADDLFPLEDALAVQVARALPGASAPVLPTTAPGDTAAPRPLPTVVYGQQPYISEVTPAPQYDTTGGYSNGPYPDVYPGYYDYPYYPFYYPYAGFYWGTGVVITGHHFHDYYDHFHGPGYMHGPGYTHGFDSRPYVSPHVNPGVYSHANRGGLRGSAGFGGARGFGGGHAGFSGGHAGFGGGGGHAGGGGGGGGMHGR